MKGELVSEVERDAVRDAAVTLVRHRWRDTGPEERRQATSAARLAAAEVPRVRDAASGRYLPAAASSIEKGE